jgi:hypothetical protein
VSNQAHALYFPFQYTLRRAYATPLFETVAFGLIVLHIVSGLRLRRIRPPSVRNTSFLHSLTG